MTPPVVILSAPQIAENIGFAARAMANFGLTELRLVSPRNGWPQPRAFETSSGATAQLDGVRVYPTVADAIADLQLVHAATARPRELSLPVLTPRASAEALHAAAAADVRTGVLFGGERAGLPTEEVSLSQAVVTIPIHPDFASLNLAQAVAVNAYEWWVRASGDAPPAWFKDAAPPAPEASLNGLFGHLEGELDASGFFFPPENKPSMVRNLRVILGRARLSEQEVRTLRGVIAALSHGRGRTLAKLAENKDAAPSA